MRSLTMGQYGARQICYSSWMFDKDDKEHGFRDYATAFNSVETVCVSAALWKDKPADEKLKDAARDVFGKPELVVVCSV